MKGSFHGFVIPVLFCIVLSLFVSCSNEEEKITSHLERAASFTEAEEYKSAIIEYRNVVQIDPKHSEARHKLGIIYLKVGDVRKAFQELHAASALDPANEDALIKTAELYYYSKKYEESYELVEKVLQKNPGNVDALILLATLNIDQEDYQSAEQILQDALKKNPEEARLYTLQAKLYSSTNNEEAAENSFLKALEINPKNIKLHQLLVNYYRIKGQPSRAQKQLEMMSVAFPGELKPLLIEGSYYIQQKDFDKAELVLLDAKKRFPGDSKVFTLLVQMYKESRQPDMIEKVLLEAVEKSTETLHAKVKLANYYFEVGRYGEAENVVSDISEENDLPSKKLIEAKLLHHKGNNEEALTILEKLVIDQPHWGEAYYQMSLIFNAKGQIELSHKYALKALEYTPNSVNARIMAAHHSLRKGDFLKARIEAGIALKLDSGNVAAAVIVGQSYFLEGDFKKSSSIFIKMNELIPENPEILYNLALSKISMNEEKDAVQLAERVLVIEPDHVRALLLIVTRHVENNDQQAALNRVKEQAENNPDSHLILTVLGDLLFKMDNFAEARKVLKKIQELRPDLPSTYVTLAKIEEKTGNLESAIDEYTTLLNQQPDDIYALMGLGVLQEKTENYTAAKKTYTRILQSNAQFAPAANNLSWLLLKDQEPDLDKALQLALQAKEALPDDGHISDTLGYIFYLRNSYDLAVHHLRHAVESLPANATVKFHLAKALYKQNTQNKQNNIKNAVEELQKALEISDEFDGKDEAEKLLVEWQKESV